MPALEATKVGDSFLCLNLFFAERKSYMHICGFKMLPEPPANNKQSAVVEVNALLDAASA